MIGGGDPLYLKFSIKLTALERNRRFSISFRSCSDSVVTPSEKSLVNTNRKSTTRPLALQRVTQKRSVQNLNNELL